MMSDSPLGGGAPPTTLVQSVRQALIARLDACVDAVEASAACFARLQPVGNNPDDWAKLQDVEDRFTALRSQLDELALSALQLFDCCDDSAVSLSDAERPRCIAEGGTPPQPRE